MKYYYSWEFRTIHLQDLDHLYKIFYNEKNIKIIPSNIIDYLSPKVLAYWLMDDGGFRKKGGMLIHTNSLKYEEVDLLCQSLNILYKIQSRRYIKKKGLKEYPIIYIPKHDYLNIIVPLIKPYFIDTMYYKLGE